MKYLFSFVIILPMVFVFSCTPKAETITANEEDAIQSMMLLLATPDPETTSLLSLKHEVRVGLVDSLLFEYRSRTKYSFFRDNGVGENQITNSYDFHVLALELSDKYSIPPIVVSNIILDYKYYTHQEEPYE